jgi:SAM-dependent methyltransferase
MNACRICGNGVGNQLHRVREMMYGSRDTFEYLECLACGCLQIASVPTNVARYYPKDYWHFQQARMPDKDSWFGRWLQKRQACYWFSSQPDPLGRLLSHGRQIPRHITWLREAGVVNFDAAVLDVGCGLGDRLRSLAQAGFRNLSGIDPYIETDFHYPDGVKVYKRSLAKVTGRYDFITLHHSFEHMSEPLNVMRHLRRLVKPSGRLLIRIPVADSRAWREYGTDWVQLDAPRHHYLHTRRSLGLLADQTGLHIDRIRCDATAFQFWGSEQYRRDIPLYDPRSFEVNESHPLFTVEELRAFRDTTWALNHMGEGDQACFYLSPM